MSLGSRCCLSLTIGDLALELLFALGCGAGELVGLVRDALTLVAHQIFGLGLGSGKLGLEVRTVLRELFDRVCPQCVELCGRDHGFMPVVVKVLSKEDYQAWLAQQKAAAQPPAEAAPAADAPAQAAAPAAQPAPAAAATLPVARPVASAAVAARG